MGYLNPLLALPAVGNLAGLPACSRLRIERVMRDLRRQSDAEAIGAWGRSDVRSAVFWRASATYARHFAHAISPGRGAGVRRSTLAASRAPAPAAPGRRRVAGGAGSGLRCGPAQLLALPAGRALLGLPVEDRALLSAALDELHALAQANAHTSWARRKAPLAGYWHDAARCARYLRRRLLQAGRSGAQGAGLARSVLIEGGHARAPSEREGLPEAAA